VTTIAEQTRTRAKPLSVDDRRAMIIDAVIPLIIEHGRAVSTKQIAEAAGIAEGTIFRVFDDKDALFEAAVEKFLDPTPSHNALRAIDPELPLEAKVNDILFQLRTRLRGVFGIMHAIGMAGPPPRPTISEKLEDVIAEVLRPDLAQLSVPADRAASFVRLIAFAAAIPPINGGREFPTADLAQLVTNGIAGLPRQGSTAEGVNVNVA
jgi:AcrR family transcriptional regulator